MKNLSMVLIITLACLTLLSGCISEESEKNQTTKGTTSSILPFYYGDYLNSGLYGLMNIDGEILEEPAYTGYYWLADGEQIYGLVLTDTNEGKCCYLSCDGSVRTGFDFESINYEHNGLATVRSIDDNEYTMQLMDLKTGQYILQNDYHMVEFLSPQLFIGRPVTDAGKAQDNHSYLYNLKEETLAVLPENIYSLTLNKYDMINDENIYGILGNFIPDSDQMCIAFVDKEGKIVILPEYAFCSDFNRGQTIANSGAKVVLLNTAGESLKTWPYDDAYGNLYDNYLMIQYNKQDESGMYMNTVHIYARDENFTLLASYEGADYCAEEDGYAVIRCSTNSAGQDDYNFYLLNNQGKEIAWPFAEDDDLVEVNYLGDNLWQLYGYDYSKVYLYHFDIGKEGKAEQIKMPVSVIGFMNVSSGSSNRLIASCLINDQVMYCLMDDNGQEFINYCTMLDPIPDGSAYWVQRGNYSGYIDQEGKWLYKMSNFGVLID